MNKSHDRKRLQRLFEALAEAGWRVAQTRNGHWRAFGPEKDQMVTFSATSDPRGLKNIVADFRRNGLAV